MKRLFSSHNVFQAKDCNYVSSIIIDNTKGVFFKDIKQ